MSEKGKLLRGDQAAVAIYEIAMGNQAHFRKIEAGALTIRREATTRLTEIADHGCEAASARAFEEGRLAVLDALLLGYGEAPPVTDEQIRQRRLDLDDALRERGSSRPDRDPLIGEPIVRPVG